MFARCKGTAYLMLASDTAIQGLQYADGYRYHFILWSEHVRSMLAHACFVLPRRIFIRLLFTAALVLAYPSQSACNCSFMGCKPLWAVAPSCRGTKVANYSPPADTATSVRFDAHHESSFDSANRRLHWGTSFKIAYCIATHRDSSYSDLVTGIRQTHRHILSSAM